MFLVAVTGQAWASTCPCDNAKPVPSCCKRKVEKNAYISGADCCGDESCSVGGAGTPAIRVGSPLLRHTPLAIVLTPVLVAYVPNELRADSPARTLSVVGRYKSWPSPPNLFVRHHAFLI
jgi:hypothetical protein